MKVFVSWSESKSRAVASALREWLPLVINEVEPFISSDIDAGARWQTEIATELEQSAFGIVCVTGQNQNAPWLNFEAGAIAKHLGGSRLVPLLIDLKPTDLKHPLAGFQAKDCSEEGILGLLTSLNAQCTKTLASAHLSDAFEMWWPRLETSLKQIRKDHPTTEVPKHRSDRDLLEEILTSVRGIQNAPSGPEYEDRLEVIQRQHRERRALADRLAIELQGLVPDDGRWQLVTAPDDPTRSVVITSVDELPESTQKKITTVAGRLGLGGVEFSWSKADPPTDR